MNKISHDRNANEEPKGKSESHKPSNNWGQVFGRSFHRLHGGSYFQNFLVGLFFALIAPAIGLFMHSKIVIIWGAAAGLMGFIIFIAIVLTREVTNGEIKGSEETDKKSGNIKQESTGQNSPNVVNLGTARDVIGVQNNILPRTDYITGTPVTYSGLNEGFPFGWIVISPFEGTRITSEMAPTRIGVKFGPGFVDSIECSPDIVHRSVTWKISNVSFETMTNGERILKCVGGTIEQTAPMIVGLPVAPSGFYIEGQPEMIVMTISDNQRTPKFVLGFRVRDSMSGHP